MRKLVFHFIAIMALILPYHSFAQSWQSSWYHGNGQEYNNLPKSFSYQEVRNRNLGNGVVFNGQALMGDGQLVEYTGTMRYPDKTFLVGTFNKDFSVRNGVRYDLYEQGSCYYVSFQNGRMSSKVAAPPTYVPSVPVNTGGSSSKSSDYNNPVQNHTAKCSGCNGSGNCSLCGGRGLNSNDHQCSRCHGTGRCQSCAGTGRIRL